MGFIDNIRRMPAMTKNLIIINVLVFVALQLPSVGAVLERYGALYYITSSQFLPTQLFSYMFMHANFAHLFFNMFSLFMFGITMERVLGGKKFLFYYITCGLGAALVQEGVFAVMVNHYASVFSDPGAVTALASRWPIFTHEVFSLGISPQDPAFLQLMSLYHTPTMGASGAVYGILLAFAFMFPNMRIYLLFPPIPLKAWVMVCGFVVIELVLGIYNSQADPVAHFAHLGGMLFGLLILLYWRKKRIIGGPYY